MENLAAVLGARVVPGDELREAAERELEEIFRSAAWGSRIDVETYTGANYRNLWDNEMPKPIRRAFEEAGKTALEYEQWLQEVHYARVVVYRKSLFDQYQDNIGWRILLLSVPAVDASAVGIASHYQGGMAHNKLALASNALYDIAAAGLEAEGYEGAMTGRKVVPEDWDGTGLIRNPVTDVVGVDVSTLTDGAGLPIKAVRSTTVKKTLASMITVTPFAPSSDDSASLGETLRQLEQVGSRLA
jgi:5-methylcytosine-specific restriction protein B